MTIESFCVSQDSTRCPASDRAGDEYSDVAELVDRYELREKLGEGGFGEVWAAYDKNEGRMVAIKGPHTKKEMTAAKAKMFLDEAEKAKRFTETGAAVVRVLDVVNTPFGDGTICFIVMELMAGSLGKNLREGRYPSEREAIALIASVAETLAVLHSQQHIHRDIKPDNILLDAEGKPYLADFGLVASTADLLEETRGVNGTICYMSPEQARGQRTDRLADIYSLGVVLYQLLAIPHVRDQRLALPYLEKDPLAYLESLKDPADHPRALPVGVSAEIAEFVEKECLSDAPSGRPRNAEEVQKRLNDWLKSQDNVSSTQAGSRFKTRSKAIACILLGLIVAGAALATINRPHGEGGAGADSDIAEEVISRDVKLIAYAEPNPYQTDGERIAINSPAHLTCIQTHYCPKPDFQFETMFEFPSEGHGIGGIALGIYQGASQPASHHCFGIYLDTFGSSPVLHCGRFETAMDGFGHVRLRGKGVSRTIKVQPGLTSPISMSATVKDGLITSLMVNGQEITEQMEEIVIPPSTGCGLVAESKVVFHQTTCIVRRRSDD